MIDQKRQAGFTIMELTIATAVFATILLVITAGIMSFSKSYLNGVHQSQTQEAARLVMDEVSQAVQFSASWSANDNGGFPAANTWYAYCFGNVKYSFQTGVPVKNGIHALVRSPYTGSNGCQPYSGSGLQPGESELLGDNMRLQAFKIVNNGDSYNIDLLIVYGANDLLDSGRCKSGPGSEFCASTHLQTTVQRRL